MGTLNAFLKKKKENEKKGNWIQYLKKSPETDILLQFSYLKQKIYVYIIKKNKNKQTNQPESLFLLPIALTFC